MAETQLTHKLRNPKSYNEWMNIWTSHTDTDESGNVFYKIYPSSDWKIPVNLLTPNIVTENESNQNIEDKETAETTTSLPIGITVPVNQLIPGGTATTANLPNTIKITADNIPSNSNVIPIMTTSQAGIAKVGTGLNIDSNDKLNVTITRGNVDTIISDNIISASKLNTMIVGNGVDPEDDRYNEETTLKLVSGTISSTDLTQDLQDQLEVAISNVTLDRIDTALLGVGIGTENSPEDSTTLTSVEKAKCGIWIQV